MVDLITIGYYMYITLNNAKYTQKNKSDGLVIIQINDNIQLIILLIYKSVLNYKCIMHIW